MNKLMAYGLSALVVFNMPGCSFMPSNNYEADNNVAVISPEKSDLTNSRETKNKLYSQYKQWQGTPYTLGGLSKKGIDCSGFVYVTYRERFGLDIPRTTKRLSSIGREISRSNLRPGDLVFFKTSYKVRHVGIYIEDDKFIHASTKKGVMISRLNDYYWEDKYWHSRRVGF